MATYYKWRKSTVEYAPYVKEEDTSVLVARFNYTGNAQSQTYTLYYGDSLTVEDNGLMALSGNVGSVTFTWSDTGKYLTNLGVPSGEKYIAFNQSENIEYINLTYKRGTNVCRCNTEITAAYFSYSSTAVDIQFGINYQLGQTIKSYAVEASPGTSQGYVYSTSSSAYPNGGVSGGYYYDQRTTVTSPTAPTGLSYPNPITTPTVTVSWNAATSNVPDYPVDHYIVSVLPNGVPSMLSYTTTGTSQEITIPQIYNGTLTTTVWIRVNAVDTNGQWTSSNYAQDIPTYFAPTLTVPQQVMQGQSVPVNWTAISGASSYTLQRKANTDADWVQVYSGGNTSFSETAGTWTSVQYRVQAVLSGTAGGWATSASIPVISASALVISGTDGDLGTVVNDIPYTISTDTGNQITATITVNSAVIFSGNVGTGAADSIPVLDLVNGEGTIVIEASVQASSGTVTAARTWTYTKAPITFPNAGSVAQLTQQGANIWPKTLAECVRLPGGLTLDQVTAFPCQVYAGSYVGTGTYGESNPNTLTFPFEPKAVFISARSSTTPNPDGTGSSSSSGALLVYDSPLNIRFGNNNAGGLSNVEWEGNSVSWYWSSGTYAAFYQLNSAGITYSYVAIG